MNDAKISQDRPNGNTHTKRMVITESGKKSWVWDTDNTKKK